MSRKLAHVEQIAWKRPIDGADRIELVGVLGWQCIAKKGEFEVGSLGVYIEIDSVVDKNNPDFEFLGVRNYKIKTQKMRGVISQGIVFPLSILPSGDYNIGDDVTDILKITQAEDEVPKLTITNASLLLKQSHKKLCKNKFFMWLMQYKWFRKIAYKVLLPKRKKQKDFPDWIEKTDEIRIQNIPSVLEQYSGTPMIVTEKLDGTSTTFGLKKLSKRKYDYAVCSRNVRQADASQKCYYDDNVYHEIGNKYKIREVLQKLMNIYNASVVVLQGETIGETIQKNKYKLTGRDFYAFNLVIDGNRVDSVEAAEIVGEYGIKWVPILSVDYILPVTIDEMISCADGKSMLTDTLREGLVIRNHSNTVSFKCISNKFLLKHNL